MLGHHGRAGTGWVAAVSVLLAGVLLTAVGVAALRTDTASADTVLARGTDAVLVLPDGTSRPAVEGERVPRGATVTAGRTGAELETRERVVHLGGGTSVTVRDGARQVLRTGFVLVEAADGPGVQLETAAGTVTTADEALVRVDGGALVRVGVLRGDAAEVRAASRQATREVPTYFQVQVPQGGLPGAASPFVLTPGDAYERALAGDLVSADEDLTALASRLDTDTRVGGVVAAALTEDVSETPTTGSEATLGYLIATASRDDADLGDRYSEVRALREDGGSWGVVAAIVDAEVGQVGAALSALLDPGTVPVLASEPLDVSTVIDLAGEEQSDAPAGPAPAGPAEPSDDGDDEQAPPGNGGGGDPEPTMTPTPSGPTDPVTEAVEDVVDTVLDLVSPSPSSSPVSVPLPLELPVLAPSPSTQLTVEVPLFK